MENLRSKQTLQKLESNESPESIAEADGIHFKCYSRLCGSKSLRDVSFPDLDSEP